jgi:hypothetical protein
LSGRKVEVMDELRDLMTDESGSHRLDALYFIRTALGDLDGAFEALMRAAELHSWWGLIKCDHGHDRDAGDCYLRRPPHGHSCVYETSIVLLLRTAENSFEAIGAIGETAKVTANTFLFVSTAWTGYLVSALFLLGALV